jgi:hypothetical protein
VTSAIARSHREADGGCGAPGDRLEVRARVAQDAAVVAEHVEAHAALELRPRVHDGERRQWERPFVLDARATEARFGVQPTRWAQVVEATARGWLPA